MDRMMEYIIHPFKIQRSDDYIVPSSDNYLQTAKVKHNSLKKIEHFPLQEIPVQGYQHSNTEC